MPFIPFNTDYYLQLGLSSQSEREKKQNLPTWRGMSSILSQLLTWFSSFNEQTPTIWYWKETMHINRYRSKWMAKVSAGLLLNAPTGFYCCFSYLLGKIAPQQATQLSRVWKTRFFPPRCNVPEKKPDVQKICACLAGRCWQSQAR